MTNIETKFTNLDNRRGALLSRAREYAELSIPALLPRNGLSETSELPVPFSATTARGLTRMASRLTSATLPLNAIPFFELQLDDGKPTAGEDPAEENKVLDRLARRVIQKMATTNLRSAEFSAFLNLQVLGTVVLYINDNYNISLYRLDNFVVRRRPDGEWHECIIRDWIDPSMPPEILTTNGVAATDDENAKPVGLFTRIVNNHKGGCSIEREYLGRAIGEKADFKVCPYIVLDWTHVSGENYGRGLVEDNLGDIRAIEVMAEALLDAIAANAEYRFGVNPSGLTEIHDLQESVNGAFVPAADGDVFPIQLGNQAQVQMAQMSVSAKEQTLGQVFLLNSAVQPQGERVTATQVRVIANELEQALGGVFSDVARALQIPLVRRFMYMMLKDGTLIPAEDPANEALAASLEDEDAILAIKIKSGLEALNREIENEKMNQIMDRVSTLPEAAQSAIIWPGVINRWFSTFGIEPTGLVRSTQEIEAAAVAEQNAQMAQQAQQQQLATTGAIAETAAANVQQGVTP
jgi:hypothetical protein